MMRLLRHFRAALRRRRLDDEMREELEGHLAWKIEELVADGLSPEEARRQAAVAVGNVSRLREDSRALWGFPSLDSIAQDVRYGLRQLRRSPLFSAIAVLSLAIGIGAGTAVFSLADAVLLRTMAVSDPGSLVILKWRSGPASPFSSLNGYGDQTPEGLSSTSFSRAAFEAFRREAAHAADVFGFADLYQVGLAVDGVAEMGTGHLVSANYFDVLGVTAAKGRTLMTGDDAAGADGAAVVSERFARRRFGDSASAIGRSVVVNNVPFTIVGALPAAFHGTGQVGSDPDVFVPFAMRQRVLPDDESPDEPNYWWVIPMARLRPGVTAADARSTLDLLLKRSVAAAKPDMAAKDYPRIELTPGGRGQVEERDQMQEPLRTMGLVTVVVLLVACANVAGLLLARGRARMRELSIRVAIGAPRRRIVRQLLTEALLIAGGGCALGVVMARWLSAGLAPALSTGLEPGDLLARVDVRVLVFAVVLAAACAVLFGVLPAVRSTDLSASRVLHEAGRGTVPGHRRRPLSAGLVVAQMALSMLLVAGAGLLVRTLHNLERVDLGFDPGNLLLFRLDPASSGYTQARTIDTYARLLDRLRALPGVDGASLSSHRLISNSSAVVVATRTDETTPPPGSAEMRTFSRTHLAWQLAVDERFFETMKIQRTRGRVFTERDASGPPLAVVNRSLARQLFGTEDVLGRQIRTGSQRQQRAPLEIVGLVEDVRYTSMREAKPPTIYLYYRQPPGLSGPATFEVRTAGAPELLAPSVRTAVRELDALLPVDRVMTQSGQIARSLRQDRLFARLAALLGSVALALAAIGLYGLLAYNVARRTPEIGVRMALGAARGGVLWMVLRESLLLAGIGLAAGVPIALTGTRVLESQLFGLPSRDPVTLAGAAGALFLVALAAGYLPARRASRVDPLVALRTE